MSTATDACGNATECEQTVTVAALNAFEIPVVLQGVSLGSAQDRCIRFVLQDSSTCNAVTVSVDVSFDGNPASGLAVFTADCSNSGWTASAAANRVRTPELHAFGSNVSMARRSSGCLELGQSRKHCLWLFAARGSWCSEIAAARTCGAQLEPLAVRPSSTIGCARRRPSANARLSSHNRSACCQSLIVRGP